MRVSAARQSLAFLVCVVMVAGGFALPDAGVAAPPSSVSVSHSPTAGGGTEPTSGAVEPPLPLPVQGSAVTQPLASTPVPDDVQLNAPTLPEGPQSSLSFPTQSAKPGFDS